MMAYVYLLHFEQPISPVHTCQHYIGFAENLPARIQLHEIGRGARLTAVAKERQIGFQVVRIWRGDRWLERKLKDQKRGGRLCPVCHPIKQRSLFELSAAQIEEELLVF